MNLDRLPTARLCRMLEDAVRIAGPDCQTAHILRSVIAKQRAPNRRPTKGRSKKCVEKRIILCCGNNGRAVVYGTVDAEPAAGRPVRLRNARMILYWSAECGGLFGLARSGPKTDTRITATVDEVVETSWQEFLAVSDAAVEKIERWPDDK